MEERETVCLTVHPGQTVHQLTDFHIQRVVADVQLVDRLVHAGQSGHCEGGQGTVRWGRLTPPLPGTGLFSRAICFKGSNGKERMTYGRSCRSFQSQTPGWSARVPALG